MNCLNDNQRKLKYPAIYKHFKDNYYATMGVSSFIDIDLFSAMLEEDNIDIWKLKKMSIKFTESKEETISVNYNGKWYHFDEYEGDLVLYKTLYDNSGVYGRPIDMFLSKVDKEKYPQVCQEYRFEEV